MDNTPETSLKVDRVREHLEALLSSGLKPHDRLPTERSLAEELEVSRITIRTAMDELEAEQRVYRVQGSGTYVGDPHISKTIRLSSFTQDMIDRGLTPSSEVLVADERAAGGGVGARLSLSPAERVVHIERLRLADGEPMCLEISSFPAALFPGLLHRDISGSLYATLHQDYGTVVLNARQQISSTVLDEEQSARLGVPAFSPALLVERTTRDRTHRVIEHAISLYRADRYSFLFDITA